MSDPGSRLVERVLVAFGGPLRGEDALEAAVELASSLQAPLTALFVEDVNLVRLSELPFARELDRASGAIRPLDPERLGRALASEARKLEERLQRESRKKRISVTMQVVRGHYMTSAVQMARSRDIVLFDDSIRAPGGQEEGARWRRPVWVVYDGSERARRALSLAANLGETFDMELVVLVPESGDKSDIADLQEAVPTERRARIHVVPWSEKQKVLSLARKRGGSVIVLPRETGEPAVPDWVVGAVGCPRILV